MQEDLQRGRDKIEKLLKVVDELQSSESSVQLAAKRAERMVVEEREARLRAERELEGWKIRGEKGLAGSVRRGGSGFWGSGTGSGVGTEENGIEVPTRKSSISRTTSLSKGFL